MISQKDIAEAAGVARSTVSLVLNDVYTSKVNVPEAKRNHIKKIAREMGYEVDDMARSIKTGKAKVIAIANSSADDMYTAIINTQLASSLNELGYSLLPVDASGINQNSEKYEDVFNVCIKNRVSALIVRGLSSKPHLQKLKNDLNSRDIEFALLSNNADVAGCISVSSYDKKAMYEVFEYLYNLGHRDFLFVATDVHLEKHTQIRMDAFKEKAQALGISHRIINVEKKYLQDALSEIFGTDGPHPTAIICSSDSYAVFTHSYLLYEYGIRCPEHYSIVGYGGKASVNLYPKMTVIKEAHKKMAESVAKKLIAGIEGRDYGELREFFADELVIGDSTTALGVKLKQSKNRRIER